jgi:hypothetical protein
VLRNTDYYLVTTSQMSVLRYGICEHANYEREIFTLTGGNFLKAVATLLVTPLTCVFSLNDVVARCGDEKVSFEDIVVCVGYYSG